MDKNELEYLFGNALLMGKIPFAKIGEVRAEQTVFCPVEQLVMLLATRTFFSQI